MKWLLKPTSLSFTLRTSITDQRGKIWRGDWKYLIILDACRYDYFAKVYRDFLPGKLEKVLSPGSSTPEWLKKVFSGKRWDDIVYISANPFINSKGIVYWGFDPRKYLNFYKIIDVWDYGWSKELGTVHPREVNKATLIATRLYKNKRLIIHYMQPHYPYLTNSGIIRIGKEDNTKEESTITFPFIKRIRSFIRWRIGSLLWGFHGFKILNKIIGFPQGPLELVAKSIGDHGLRRAYEENLRLVLSYVGKLINGLHGKIVITTDHGELLGERGLYGHHPGKRIRELIEVPWLKIEKTR